MPHRVWSLVLLVVTSIACIISSAMSIPLGRAILLIPALSCLMLLDRSSAQENVVPLDLAKNESQAPIDLRPAGPGEYEWTLPQGTPQILRINLQQLGISPHAFDEIRFELKPLVSQVGLHTIIFGHPAKDALSSWYLKFPARTGVWSEGRFDLHLDDDGIYIGRGTFKESEPQGIMTLKLYRRILGYLGEPSERRVLLRNFRLVKRLISVDYSLLEAEIIESSGEVGAVYTLRIKNLTDKSQKVKLELDSASTLKYFEASSPADQFELGPGEEKALPVRLSMPTRKAMALPPLYSEALIPKVSVPGIEDSDVIPLMGYRRFPLWGVVPLFDRPGWDPVSLQAMLDAREKVIPAIKEWKTAVVRAADQAMAYRWPIPDFGPPIHDQAYRCDKCRDWMKPETPISLHKHFCPKCKATFENNDRYDRAWLMRYNHARAMDVRNLALAHLLTGKDDYAQKSSEILRDYAAAYPTMPIYDRRSTSGGSKLGANTLHSSYVIPYFAEGYAFLRGASCLDEGQRHSIVRFLKDAAGDVVVHSVEYNNQQAEHFRAYGSVGLATGFWPLAAEAIYGDFGWHELVEYGFSEDGIAHEGGAYHRSVFGATNEFATFAYGFGINLYTARFKRVFDGSLAAGAVPVGHISYELPYLVYRDPRYLPVLSGERHRLGEVTALHGILGLPDAQKLPVVSSLMSTSGYIYLRKGTAADWIGISLNYIKPFDRHERDKFTTFFYQNGSQVDSTVGRITYGSPHSAWMESTAAHNTIVIDGMEERDMDGQLLFFDPSLDAPIGVVATATGAGLYEGVQQLRCIALIEDFYVVFDRVTSDRPCTIDRYQYGHGPATFHFKTAAVEKSPEFLPRLGAFSQIEGGPCGQELRIDFKNSLNMVLVSDGEMEAYKGLTVGHYQADPMEFTFARRTGSNEAAFLAVFCLGQDKTLPSLKILKTAAEEMAFELACPEKAYVVTIRPTEKKVSVTSPKR